jgi:hypothetical protein
MMPRRFRSPLPEPDRAFEGAFADRQRSGESRVESVAAAARVFPISIELAA